MLFAALVLVTATPVAAPAAATPSFDRFALRSYYTGAEEVPVDASHRAVAIGVDQGLSAAAVAVLVEGAIDDKLASAGVSVAGAKRVRPGLFDIELAHDVDATAMAALAHALAPRVNGVWPVLTRRSGRAFSDDKLVITAEAGHFDDVLAQVLAKTGGALVRRSNIANTALVSVGDPFSRDAVNASAALHGLRGAVSIEPDLYRELAMRSVTVNDPLFTTQWHLSRQGSTVPGVGQIFADVAWDTTMGDPNVIIAVFDTGVDLSHEDLENQFVPGFDAAGNDDDPSPECSAAEDGAGQVSDCPTAQPFKQSHATSVSGIIAAEANNGIGVTGVCPLCKIMPVRILGDDAASGLGIGEAFTRAVDDGAWAINNSWGPGASVFFPLSQAERDGLAHAKSTGRNGLGTVILFAAGNDTADVVSDPYAGNPQVITVAGSTNVDDWAEYSNFGKEIDVAAPTQGLPAQEDNFPDDDFGIVTTDLTGADGYDPGNYTNEFNGTSASCPVATGVVGLVLSTNPNLTDDQVRLTLTRSADKIVADKVPWQDLIGQDIETVFAYDEAGHSVGFGFGRVNAASAVAAAHAPGLEGAKCDAAGCTFCDSLDRCLLECTQQSDCPDGSACNIGLGACELPQEKPASFLSPCTPDCPFCTTTIDDEDNLVDICTARCAQDSDCPGGFDCRPITDNADGPGICIAGNVNAGQPASGRNCLAPLLGSSLDVVADGGHTLCSDICFADTPGACPHGMTCGVASCTCTQQGNGGCRTETCVPDGNPSDPNGLAICLPNAGFTDTCALDADCELGDYCVDGHCRVDDRQGCDVCATCTDSTDCTGRGTCSKASFQDATGVCVWSCENDGACPGDSACVAVTGRNNAVSHQCVAKDGGPTNATRCTTDYTCAVACRDDVPCGDGQACESGACVTKPATHNPPASSGPDLNEAPAGGGCGGCAQGDATPLAAALLALVSARALRRRARGTDVRASGP